MTDHDALSKEERAKLIDSLAHGPSHLQLLVARVPGHLIEEPPARGAWSAREIIGHVRASDAITSPRIRQVLMRPGVALRAFDERRWAHLAASAQIPIDRQIDAFSVERAELVAVIHGLAPSDWSLAGHHEVSGRVTIAGICQAIATHEDEHWQQLERLVEVFELRQRGLAIPDL